MKSLSNNTIAILLGLLAVVLIFIVLRLADLVSLGSPPPLGDSNTVEVAQGGGQAPTGVVTQTVEAPAAPTNTPEPTVVPATATQGYTVYGAFIVGAIHVGPITDRGYNQAHHDALQQAIKNIPGTRLIEVENIPENEQVATVLDDLVQQGAKVIFGQSFGYLPFMVQAAERYPDVVFLHPGGFETRENLGTYWANNYEAMYLAGISAGAATKTGKLGFITAFPIPLILASVNSFELGARSVNPNVTTELVITGSWVNPEAEARATNALSVAGVDVVTMLVDSPTTIVQTAEARGMYVIGFHSASLQELAPRGWLTGIDYTWANYYTLAIQDVRNQQWRSANLRGGIESDMIGLAPFGPSVSPDTQNRIAAARDSIIQGALKIFLGPIRDNLGVERIKAGEFGGIELLDTTDWLMEGVSQFDPMTVNVDSLPPVPTLPPPAVEAAAPAAPAEAAAPQAEPATNPAPAPVAPNADVILGAVQNDVACSFFSKVTQEILERELQLSVSLVEFASSDDLYLALANRQKERRVDVSLCFVDPKDRTYLRQYFGFIKQLSEIYWQSGTTKMQVVTNSGQVAKLQQEQPCVYRLLRNLRFEGDQLPTQDPVQWVNDNTEQIQRWTGC